MNQQAFDKAASLLDSLSNQFSYKKFFLIFITLFYMIGPFIIFENYTGYLQLKKINKQTEIYKELVEINSKFKSLNDNQIESIGLAITSNFKQFLEDSNKQKGIPAGLKNAYAALVPWVIFILIFMPGKSLASDSSIFTIMILAIGCTSLSYLLPSFKISAVNIFIYPIIAFVLANVIYLKIKDKIIRFITNRFKGHT